MPDQRAHEQSQIARALGSHYLIERELGRGGMGVVYLARDRMLDRLVAIKTLPAHLAADERVRDRFLREARTAGSLSHPHIVPIHRADEIDGIVFFVMGFVDGESIADLVRTRGSLPVVETVGYLRDVADALEAAHRRGVVHRDVKAENILIDSGSGRALVTDFGIARVVEAAPMTATGMILGSVHYMSPEHASGETVDARSDVYSLGVVGFFALSGRFPFENESASAVLVAHVTKRAPLLGEVAPHVPVAIAAVIDRCLAKDPGERWDSARSLREALEQAARASGEALPVKREPPPLSGRLSDREAQEVFRRAAALDQGIAAPPATTSEPNRGPVSTSSSYPVSTIREAARDAGVATRHIDRAIEEHRAAAGAARAGVEDHSPETLVWTGAPARLEFEVAVEGEIPERDFDRLVESIRRTIGDVGLVSAVGSSFTWTSTEDNRKIHINVQIRNGRTIIRAGERLGAFSGSVYGGGIGGFGFGAGGGIAGAVMGVTQSGFLAGSTLLAAMTLATAITRVVFTRLVQRRRTELRELTERLATEARAAIAERAASRRIAPRPWSSDERLRVR